MAANGFAFFSALTSVSALFNKVTDVIKMLEESNPNKAMGEAVAFLRMAQMKCDDIYIEGDDYFNEDI